jgi:hypothetical protein
MKNYSCLALFPIVVLTGSIAGAFDLQKASNPPLPFLLRTESLRETVQMFLRLMSPCFWIRNPGYGVGENATVRPISK